MAQPVSGATPLPDQSPSDAMKDSPGRNLGALPDDVNDAGTILSRGQAPQVSYSGHQPTQDPGKGSDRKGQPNPPINL